MCVPCVLTHLYFLAALVCASPPPPSLGGPVWFREPLCPFIAEEWRLFTHAVGVTALTSIRSLWLVKMQFWTCSRPVNVWQGWSRGPKLKTMMPPTPVNDVDCLISHFCQLMSAKPWHLARFNHKAVLLLNETLHAFWVGEVVFAAFPILQSSSTNFTHLALYLSLFVFVYTLY